MESKELLEGCYYKQLSFHSEEVKLSAHDMLNIYDGGLERDYEPIKLTEQWLLRANFEKINHISGYTFYLHKKYKFSVYLDSGKIEWMGYRTGTKFYVHSLQQLCRAIYSIDLEFNGTTV